jgi:hypothetical protein
MNDTKDKLEIFRILPKDDGVTFFIKPLSSGEFEHVG